MLRSFQTLRGFALAAADGEIGKVREFYFDDKSWTVRYFVIETGSWFFGKRVLIAPGALGEVDPQGHTIGVRLTQEQVRQAPPWDSEKPVARQHEAALHQHYGWDPYWIFPGAYPGVGMTLPTSVLQPDTFADENAAAAESSEPADERPTGDPHLRSSAEVTGYTIHAEDREEAGRVHDFVLDDEAWRVRYLIADAGKWLVGKSVLFAPEWVEEISFPQKEIFVNLTRSAIKDAPAFDPQASVSRAFEQKLHEHYQRKGYWDAVESSRSS